MRNRSGRFSLEIVLCVATLCAAISCDAPKPSLFAAGPEVREAPTQGEMDALSDPTLLAPASEKPDPAKMSERTRSKTPEGFRLGTGLMAIIDWSTEWTFIDAFKASRPWISGGPDVWEDERPLELDEHGWVKRLLPDQWARTVLFFGDLEDKYPSGEYIVLFDGEGDIEYYHAAQKDEAESRPGRHVINVDASKGGFGLFITRTDPGNYIRNIHVIMPGGMDPLEPYTWYSAKWKCPTDNFVSFEDLYEKQPFHPAFLSTLRMYKAIRFMDWLLTNNSPNERWENRPLPTDARWSTDRGVPIEVAIDLANRMQVDAWFNIPHKADDRYVREFARLITDKLDPELRVFVEYSNETWNGVFGQADYCRARGLELGLSDDAYQAQLFFHSMRSVQVFRIFEDTFGVTDRLTRVMAAQAGNPWTTEQELEFQEAFRSTDALAIAPYFGGYLGDPEQTERVEAMSIHEFFRELEQAALPQAVDTMQKQAEIARKYGLPLIAYEGGQHLVGNGGVENNDRINALFDTANRDSRMGDLYLEYFEAWRKAGGGPFMHFVNCGPWSKWGRWGALEYITQPPDRSPKYRALRAVAEWSAAE